jgi:hypothetical protein
MNYSKINHKQNKLNSQQEDAQLSFHQKQEQRLLVFKAFWESSMERRAIEVEKCGFYDLAQKVRLSVEERKIQHSYKFLKEKSVLLSKKEGSQFDLNAILELWLKTKEQLSVSDQLRFGQMLGDLKKIKSSVEQRRLSLKFRKNLLNRRLQTWTIRIEDNPRKTLVSNGKVSSDKENQIKIETVRGPYHGATILRDSLQSLAAADPVWLYDWYKLYQDLEDIE